VALLGAIPGIGLAIVVAVIEFLWDGWRPHSAVLGRVVTFDAKRVGFGGFDFTGSPEPEERVAFIAPDQVRSDDIVVDLRGFDEAPVSPFAGARRLVVDTIDELGTPSARVVLACRSGQRALMAADRLRERGVTNLALVALG